MKHVICLLLLTICCVFMTYSQPCRQVTSTICDENVSNFSGQKGDKGDVGFPGKSGKQGSKGSKGYPGEKGIQGESCAVESLGEDILRRLAAVEDLVRPGSCINSLLDGSQFLRFGIKAYCEEGWTVFQRRFDGSVNFQRTWDEYKIGFGDTEGEFWLGLDVVHKLTRSGKCELRVELQNFDDSHYWAQYSTFSVGSEANLYQLHVGGYTGNTTDALTRVHNNQPFTTMDKDNDSWRLNCASENYGSLAAGGWWYQHCESTQLNSIWGEGGRLHWGGSVRKATTMKFRCE
ncbi:fibrinogen-like protein A isoform X2 [Clavelina lepadiformis]|uniref:fibrinogen-like protein A isoform X2 n=1 Tax=Clavelina lepadiformis TaxID=159417 RepID=UPI0040432706